MHHGRHTSTQGGETKNRQEEGRATRKKGGPRNQDARGRRKEGEAPKTRCTTGGTPAYREAATNATRKEQSVGKGCKPRWEGGKKANREKRRERGSKTSKMPRTTLKRAGRQKKTEEPQTTTPPKNTQPHGGSIEMQEKRGEKGWGEKRTKRWNTGRGVGQHNKQTEQENRAARSQRQCQAGVREGRRRRGSRKKDTGETTRRDYRPNGPTPRATEACPEKHCNTKTVSRRGSPRWLDAGQGEEAQRHIGRRR